MMHILKVFRLALAGFFVASAALAQQPGAVTQHAFAIGKGAGQTGFVSLLCGSAQLAVGQTSAAPICRTITGDVTITAAGVTAIGSGVVTNTMLAGSIALTKLASQNAYTLIGNTSGSSAGPTAFKISALTDRAGFGSGDKLMIEESSGELRKIDYTDLPGSGSLGGSTGATDNRVLRADGTGGATVQSSAVTIDDSGNVSGVVDLAATTVSGSVVAAQAGQETATSTTTVVTPGRQQFHPSAAKAWAYCTNSAGTYTLAASYNISGGTCGKVATGQLDLTFSTAFSSSTAYACVATSAQQVGFAVTQNQSASVVRAFMFNVSAAALETSVMVTCYGDQ